MDPVSVILPGLVAGTEFAKGFGKDAWEGVKKLFSSAPDKAALAKLEADPSDAKAAASLTETLAQRSADDIAALRTALGALQPLLGEPKLAEAVNINLQKIKAKGGVTFEKIATDIGAVRIQTGDIESEGAVTFSGIGGPLAGKKY